ncbi:hypothetical protein IWQ60_009504 [Tieghemiomyces parasiticus]|uniref:MARVEL domain-containing protein n=1 Tax=Tieghemiomyces parasiticus TaxID=78921 RepID=A0A9W7ZP46_9FUNG|nr:hypothetical protein IWQ60_009504 [Tieghemiomyces parasiticus]
MTERSYGHMAMPIPGQDTEQPTGSSYGIAAPTVADSPYGAAPSHDTHDTYNPSHQPYGTHSGQEGYGSQFNLPPGVIPVSVPHSGSPAPPPAAVTANFPAPSAAPVEPVAVEAAVHGDKPGGVEVPVYNKYSFMTVPDKRKEVLRFFQIVAGVGALGFLAGASPRSGRDSPFSDSSPTNFQYFVSGLSIAVSLFFFLSFFWRFKRPGSQKARNWGLVVTDFILLAFWVASIVASFIKNKCSVGTLDGYCDFYNTSLFFCILSALLYLITFGWSIVAFFQSRRRG